jgi:hypothetical protein
MPVTCRLIICAALCSSAIGSVGLAQNTPSYDRSTGGIPAAPAPNDNQSGGRSAVATGPNKPKVKEGRPPIYPSNPLSYRSTPLNYLSNESRLRTRRLDPASAAAQRQSGLNQAEAASLMTTKGYTQIGEVHADPNSLWVWQADAMRNGRKVHLGVDNRGNLIDMSAGQAQPCTTPGVGFGAGPMGVGSRLSGVASCR